MSAIFLFGNALYSGIMLYTAALVLEFITGMDVTYAILIVAAVALAYTLLGGISAVIWTDLMQTAVLFAGAFIIFAMVLAELPGSLLDTLAALKAQGRTDPLRPLLGPGQGGHHLDRGGRHVHLPCGGLWGEPDDGAAHPGRPHLGGRQEGVHPDGLRRLPHLCVVLRLGPAVLGLLRRREFADGNKIVLEFVAAIGVPGLMGVVTAAVVAAAMSSLDSSLNSMATVTTLDFYEKFFNKHSTPQRSLAASRWFTVLWGC